MQELEKRAQWNMYVRLFSEFLSVGRRGGCRGGRWVMQHKSSARSGLGTKESAVAMPTTCMCTHREAYGYTNTRREATQPRLS